MVFWVPRLPPPDFTAPGGWTIHDEGGRMRVRQHGQWRGDVMPAATGFTVVRNEAHGKTHHQTATVLDGLAFLGVPVAEMK